MKRSLWCSVLGGVLGWSGSAWGQGFAVDRASPPASSPSSPAVASPSSRPAPLPASAAVSTSGFQPASASASPPSGVVPAGGIPPQANAPRPWPGSNAELDVMIPSALDRHPWALKPEHGPYVICVRSYSRPAWVQDGPTALSLAEALAQEIRNTHKTPAYLFEYVSEEKKAEFARREAARREQEPFLRLISEQRARAQAQGYEFLEPENGKYTYRYKTVRYNDQFAVIIAGFRTDADARKALEIVRKWEPPRNVSLMDLGMIVPGGNDGKGASAPAERGYINPYKQAFVCPNPTIPRQSAPQSSGLDAFTIKLNEGRPYNLLKVSKPWTLAVKQFSAPAALTGADGDASAARLPTNGADVLNAGAEMAEQLATFLRSMKDQHGQPRGEEAYVLHTRTGSLVTVGQFDSPDDPLLLQTLRRLNAMNFTMSDRRDTPGRPLGPQDKLFSDNIVPIPVPR